MSRSLSQLLKVKPVRKRTPFNWRDIIRVIRDKQNEAGNRPIYKDTYEPVDYIAYLGCLAIMLEMVDYKFLESFKTAGGTFEKLTDNQKTKYRFIVEKMFKALEEESLGKLLSIIEDILGG